MASEDKENTAPAAPVAVAAVPANEKAKSALAILEQHLETLPVYISTEIKKIVADIKSHL